MRGQIRKRGKKWAIVIYLGADKTTGKKRYKWYTHKTQREAETHLTQLLVQMQGGTGVPPSRLRLADYLEQWIRDSVSGPHAPTTEAIYKYAARHYITPGLGHIPMARLTPPAIQGHLNAMLGRGLSRSTVHQIYRTLNTALATAVQWGLLLRNPCEYVKPPHAGRRPTVIWDEEQTHVFLAEARRSSRYYRLYLAIVLTGMRPGEALALRWSDVDLTLGMIVVSQKFYRLGARQIWGETKTHKENAITIPPVLVEELTRLRGEQTEHRKVLGAGYQDSGLVFCQPSGKPLHAHNISQRDFKGLMTRLKLPRIRLYDLRGCHATYLADQGTPVHIIQSRLGHSSPEVALKYYIRARAKFQKEAADRLAERLLADAPDAENSRE